MRLIASPSCSGVPGGGDRVVADVEVDVEVGVLDPVRQVEAERHLDEAPPERGQLVDPFEDELLRRLDTRPAGHAGGVVDVQRGDVAVTWSSSPC